MRPGTRPTSGSAGTAYRLRVSRCRAARYRVELDGVAVDVDVDRPGRFERLLRVGGRAFSVLSVAQGTDYLIEVDGAVHRLSGGEAGLVRAPAAAMVVAIPVQAGDEVAEGDVVAVVESMKLETALHAPASGRVAEVLADVNTQVEAGTKLVRIEPDPGQDADGEPEPGERASLSALGGVPVADQAVPRPWPRPTRSRRCARWCSASTSTGTRRASSCRACRRRGPPCPPTTRGCSRARPRSCRSSPT